jgi:Fe2+ transport system protein B
MSKSTQKTNTESPKIEGQFVVLRQKLTALEERQNVNYALLDKRVRSLEDSQVEVRESQKEIILLKNDISNLSSKVKEINDKVEMFHKEQSQQGAVVNSIKKEMCEFIKKHKEDAPKAIKTMKRLIGTQIVASLALLAIIMTFIFWQTQRIITLQDRNIQLNLEVIENEASKNKK